MKHSVQLPRNFNRHKMFDFLSQVIDRNGEPLAFNYDMQFGKLAFIDPDGLTALANSMEWLRSKSLSFTFSGHHGGGSAINYLDDCGFFKEYEGQKLRFGATSRPTTIPLKKIRITDSHAWLDISVVPWLAAKMGVNVLALSEIAACMRELFNNINDHSNQELGCVHIQWFPNENRIRLSVSDFGIGIPTEIAKVFNAANDHTAIQHAAKEGVTSKPGGSNLGAGLRYLIDNVVGRYKGWVGIYLNRGHLACSPSGERARPSPGFYPGTLITIDLPDYAIVSVADEREDLSWP